MPKVDIVFRDVEIGGQQTEGAILLALTKEFGNRRVVIEQKPGGLMRYTLNFYPSSTTAYNLVDTDGKVLQAGDGLDMFIAEDVELWLAKQEAEAVRRLADFQAWLTGALL